MKDQLEFSMEAYPVFEEIS